jgi:pSer/pThr/pTyr-binding forkhead associated (FHA) protein
LGGGRPGQARTEVLYPKGPRMIAMLVGVEGAPGIAGQIFRLDTNEATMIGRDYDCDIVIDEPAVSRKHAKVKLEEVEKGSMQFFIQDLATENGTVVNGQKVVKHYLSENDRITLGRATLVFKLVDETPAG